MEPYVFSIENFLKQYAICSRRLVGRITQGKKKYFIMNILVIGLIFDPAMHITKDSRASKFNVKNACTFFNLSNSSSQLCFQYIGTSTI